MSKPALYLLILASLMGALVFFVPLDSERLAGLAKLTFGIVLGLFVLALALGRRIKFDPVLR
ncbi:MAG TPA: PA3371 family protein [Pseudomonas sp.]|nr:PA3371 family protein [Pseudomonas sp.]